MRLSLFFLICLLVNTAFAATNLVDEPEKALVKNVTVIMQEHAYTLGDIIPMHVEFLLDKAYVFDENSVPLKGPMNAWLDLRDVRVKQTEKQQQSHISIDFTWQIFGTVAEAQKIHIPSVILHAYLAEKQMNEEETAKPEIITIPKQGFYLSPVLPEKLTDEEAPRPIIVPPQFDERTPSFWASFFFVLALLLAGLWLWWQDKILWLPRSPGPMTLLARQLRQQKVVHQTHLSKQDLRQIHASLAAAAGQSLYPNTLIQLFENAPYLEAERKQIQHFFIISWQQFHSHETAGFTLSVSETLGWVKRVAIVERLYRKRTTMEQSIDNTMS